jgi:hypothetical protein
MAGILDTLTKGLNPVGIGAGIVGGALNIIGGIGLKDEAERQMYAAEKFGKQQRETFEKGYGDLLASAKGLSTYKGDLSRYTRAEQAADMMRRTAGAGQMPGEARALEQTRQSTANMLSAAQRGAGSGADLLAAAALGQAQEGAQVSDIMARSQTLGYEEKQRAQDQYMRQLAETAAASARERGLEFESLSGKENTILGLNQQKLQGGMNLENQLFQQQQAAAGAVAKAKGALWSGGGDLFSGIGSGLMDMQAQADNMDLLKSIYKVPDNKPAPPTILADRPVMTQKTNIPLPTLNRVYSTDILMPKSIKK